MIIFGAIKRLQDVIREKTVRLSRRGRRQPDEATFCGPVPDHPYAARWEYDRNRDSGEGQTGNRSRRRAELGHRIRAQHRRMAEAGLSPVPGKPGVFGYGFIPPGLFTQIKARFLELARQNKSGAVRR
jgi:hypothetical protein